MITKTRKRKNLSMNKKVRLEEGIKIWTGMFRSNLNRFAIDYLELNLHPFQQIMLYLMQINLYTTFITARGLSKSFTVAIFLCCKAILYPNIKILISCSTKSQSRALIKEKIEKELMSMSPNLRREIDEIKVGINETVVRFKNGSTIEAINASQNTRGLRCQILVVGIICLAI